MTLSASRNVTSSLGGGLWSVAARLARWPDNRPIWTASCPCQPFSVAGKGAGADDERHLWPDLFRLARARRPFVIVGEQVAGKAGYGWFDGVRADLASERYSSRYVDIPACAVDAPHIRQRGYWVAVARAEGDERGARLCESRAGQRGSFTANSDGGDKILVPAEGVTLGDALCARLEGQRGDGDHTTRRTIEDRPVAAPDDCDMEYPDLAFGRIGDQQSAGEQSEHEQESRIYVRPGSRNGSNWADHEWLICHDGKARRTQPGIPLLVDGFPGRVALWRVAGNAISPILAAEVIGALKDDLDAGMAERAAV